MVENRACRLDCISQLKSLSFFNFISVDELKSIYCLRLVLVKITCKTKGLTIFHSYIILLIRSEYQFNKQLRMTDGFCDIFIIKKNQINYIRERILSYFPLPFSLWRNLFFFFFEMKFEHIIYIKYNEINMINCNTLL